MPKNQAFYCFFGQTPAITDNTVSQTRQISTQAALAIHQPTHRSYGTRVTREHTYGTSAHNNALKHHNSTISQRKYTYYCNRNPKDERVHERHNGLGPHKRSKRRFIRPRIQKRPNTRAISWSRATYNGLSAVSHAPQFIASRHMSDIVV